MFKEVREQRFWPVDGYNLGNTYRATKSIPEELRNIILVSIIVKKLYDRINSNNTLPFGTVYQMIRAFLSNKRLAH